MKVVIVGGGTAGWITLSYLAATIDAELTIIHSNEIDTIGVGESTTPTVKYVADTIGVDERSWMRAGKAVFKYGIEFLNFNLPGSRWYHTFDDILPGAVYNTPLIEFGKYKFQKSINSVEFFLYQRSLDPIKYNTDYFLTTQSGTGFLTDHQLSPFTQAKESNFNKLPGYSYHINAFEFGNCLRDHTPSHKYREIRSTVVDVEQDHNGISAVVLQDGTKIHGDIFVDCSGFKKLLIGKFTDFMPYMDLINNAAVWGPVKTQEYRPSTMAIAQDNGWIWETPTWGQTGSGYVYSNDFLTEDRAIEHLAKHWASKGKKWEPFKSTTFQSGRLKEIAVKNVISNGLCQGFIEPLEATSIMVTCVTVRNMAKLYNKHQGWNDQSSKILSKVIGRFIDDTKDFVTKHYTLSSRTDTEYWRSYDKKHAVEEISNKIQFKINHEWLYTKETNFGLYNWASMLVGYDKPYLGSLPNLSNSSVEDYNFYTSQLIDNYEWHYKKNISVKDYLEFVHVQDLNQIL